MRPLGIPAELRESLFDFIERRKIRVRQYAPNQYIVLATGREFYIEQARANPNPPNSSPPR